MAAKIPKPHPVTDLLSPKNELVGQIFSDNIWRGEGIEIDPSKLSISTLLTFAYEIISEKTKDVENSQVLQLLTAAQQKHYNDRKSETIPRDP